MKTLIIITLVLLPVFSFAQRSINQEIPVSGVEELSLHFEWAEIVTVRYHDESEVRIEGKVSINNGMYDDAFQISSVKEGNILKITGHVVGMDTMEQITVIRKKKEDDKTYYQNNNIVRMHSDQNDIVTSGIMMDIFLTVYLPKELSTVIESKFGLIEIKEVAGPLTAVSKFGGIDVTINENQKADFKAATAFGEIYTDLQVDFFGDGQRKVGGWHRINAALAGGGNLLEVESKFGNVYIRRQK